MSKIVLDLCGGTGAWSRPYKEAGYDVRLVTLPKTDVRTWKPGHYETGGHVHGILAAPPCTMFSLARTTAKKPRDFAEGMEVVEACLNIIWFCRKHRGLKFWALENPTGFLRQFLGRPPVTFNPCDYGDPYTKKTDLWGFFQEPKKRPVSLTAAQVEACRTNAKKHYGRNGLTRQEVRAITPPGFAKAFFEANP